MSEILRPDDVQAALDRAHLDIRIRFFETTTATSQQAADNIGCALGQIVKSIAFVVDERPILVLASGDQRVDDRKIAVRYDVGRKKVKVASPEQMVTIYGYPPGSMPPVAHRTPGIDVLLDETLGRFDLVYAAGGAHNAIFPITVQQLQTITCGHWLDVVRREDDTPRTD